MSRRHGLGRMLAIMERAGSITPAMRLAGLELDELVAAGRALTFLSTLGPPSASCLLAVVGRGLALRQWAEEGWQSRPIAQETASGILIGALGALAHGNARLLLDEALARPAGTSPQA